METPVQKFEVLARTGARPYQRRRNKNSSGDCSWHSRTKALRELGRLIYEWPVVRVDAYNTKVSNGQ